MSPVKKSRVNRRIFARFFLVSGRSCISDSTESICRWSCMVRKTTNFDIIFVKNIDVNKVYIYDHQMNYPRSKFKKIIKSKTPLLVRNDSTDILIYLNYMHFYEKLIANAKRCAIRDGSSEILSKHLQEAKQITMKEFKV